MRSILVSNNSELLRHLSASPFRQLGLSVRVAKSGDEALALAADTPPDLAILDAEMPGVPGYDIAKKLSEIIPGCRVVLVMGKRITGEQMQRLTDSGCAEVLIAPMSADELYDVVTIQLGLQRHDDRRYSVDIAEVTPDGLRPIPAQVTNLSIDGARLRVQETVVETTRLQVTIRFHDDDAGIATSDVGELESAGSDEPAAVAADASGGGYPPLVLSARALWVQEGDDDTVFGASFEGLTREQRDRLSRITQWELTRETERTRIVIKGDITEAVSFDGLLPSVVGRVSFDMSKVRYMNSLGVREWVDFLDRAQAQGYEFHACSIAFVLQASMIAGVVGRGTIVSFFAPYACEVCDYQDETLLQTATILAANYEPPTFSCEKCGGRMVLDDIPERYFAFLMPDDALS